MDLEGPVDADYARFLAEFYDLIHNGKPTQESRAVTALMHSNKEDSFFKRPKTQLIHMSDKKQTQPNY